jgi:SAM-dependent methyltransferase
VIEGYLRPWAERLTGLVAPRPGRVAVDVMSDGGVLLDALARAGADALGVDEDEGVVAGARRGMRPGPRMLAVGDASALPLADGGADVVASLFTLGCARSPRRCIEEMRRLRAPGGRVAFAVWSGDVSVERILADVFDSAAVHPPLLTELLAPDLGDTAWLDERVMRDTARFDSFDLLWMGLVTQRPLAGALTAMDLGAREELRDACARRVAQHTAADGTLRIPVEARIFTSWPPAG